MPAPLGPLLGAGLGTVLGLVRPYDAALLAGVEGLAVVLTSPAREWPRRLLPVAALAPVLAYNAWLVTRPSARRLLEPYAAVAFSPGDLALGLGPAVLLALAGAAPARTGRARGHRLRLALWAALALVAVLLRPVSFSLQFGVGAGVPLLVLGAAGLARLAPRWTALAALCLSTSAVVATRIVLADDPNWFVPRERLAAGLALRGQCLPGDRVLAPPDIGLYVHGLTACDAFVSHPAAPDYAERLAEARAFYAEASPAARAELVDRQGITHLLLPGHAGPRPAAWLGRGHDVPGGGAGGPGPRADHDLRPPPAADARPRPRARRAVKIGPVTSRPDGPIAFTRPWFDSREEAAVREALAGQISGDGPIGRRVEARLAGQLGASRVLLTTSGTHALELALLALGIGPGQEVVCPSFTFVSSANAVLRVGARPVFADIEERTLGLDPADVERRLTPRTSALLPVHYAGVAPDMEALLGIARRRGLRVVEDAAQGLGATWRGRALGTLGDAGCLSFHETKNVTCGEGGALVVADPEIAQPGRDRPREGHEPRRLLPRGGGQVHLGGGGLELRALGRARRDPRRPARQARARSRRCGRRS